jgi:hypothetical protein
MFEYNVQAVLESKETLFINVNARNNWPIEFMTYKEFKTVLGV